MVISQAVNKENDENAPSAGLHSYLIQAFIQTVGFKRVPKTFAMPVASLPNNSSGAIDAALKPSKPPNQSNWSMSAFYRPEWKQNSMGRIENDHHDGPRNDRHAIQKQDPSITSFTTGMVAGLSLRNGLMIESGLSIFDQTSAKGRQMVRPHKDSIGGYRLRFDFAEGYSNIKLKNGNTPSAGDSVTITGATTHIRYLGIPLQVSYPLRFGKFYAIPMAGVTYQMLISGKLEAQVQQGQDTHRFSESNIGGLKNSFLTGQAGLNFEYRLTPALRLQVNPTYRFSVSPVNKGAAVQYFPAAWGVGLGFRWTLR
jgi:hypothetical protein